MDWERDGEIEKRKTPWVSCGASPLLNYLFKEVGKELEGTWPVVTSWEKNGRSRAPVAAVKQKNLCSPA